MHNGHRRSWGGIVALLVVTALLSSGITAYAITGRVPPIWRLPFGQQTPFPAQPGTSGPFALLEEVRKTLQTFYVDPERVTDARLAEAAIAGMVEAAEDPYTVYLTKEHYQSTLEQLQPTYSGVGVRVELTPDGYVTIVAPVPGTPGEKAGLRSGDRIVGVDGADLVGVSLDEAVLQIKGPEGTSLTLTIERDGERFDVTLVREKIITPTVEYALVGPDIGYIRLWEFNTDVSKRVQEAIDDLRGQEVAGLVFDLRQNPGGLLDEAVKVADILVPAGEIVRVEPRHGEARTYRANGQGLDLPFVVLVDQFSASASEVLAGAIKDRGVAPLVGVKTFGKGIVQTIMDLSDGSALKLTTARFLTPSGAYIHGEGIEPHVQVVPPETQRRPTLEEARDPAKNEQMAKAVDLLRTEIARRAEAKEASSR